MLMSILFVFLFSVKRRPMFFFFNDTATTEISTLPLHDALPISATPVRSTHPNLPTIRFLPDGSISETSPVMLRLIGDRKSTRLNSSHSQISYAVFCLKKKTVSPLVRAKRNTKLRLIVHESHNTL